MWLCKILVLYKIYLNNKHWWLAQYMYNIGTVVCFTGRIPFAFLEDIHQRFVKTYGPAVLTAQAYGMNDEFSRVLSQQMEYYSNDPNADRMNRLKGEMSQVSLKFWVKWLHLQFVDAYNKLQTVFIVVNCGVMIYKQVRNVMIQNIDKVLERGDRLESLVDKTTNMQSNTFRFKKQSRRFRNTMWWQNVKLMYFF